MNHSLRVSLLLFACITIFISCKKDNPGPTSSGSNSTCRLVSSSFNTIIGSYISTGSGVYAYNPKNQPISEIGNSSSGTPPDTGTFQYDSQGRPSVNSDGNGNVSTLVYDSNNNLIRVNNNQNGIASGYTLYTYIGNTGMKGIGYSSLGIPVQMALYTISGANVVQASITNYGQADSTVTSSSLTTYNGFDDKFSARYIAFQNWPPTVLLSYGINKNNPQIATYATIDYYNGSPLPSASTTTSIYTYNSSGAVIKQIDTNISPYQYGSLTPNNTSVTTTYYDYSGCN